MEKKCDLVPVSVIFENEVITKNIKLSKYKKTARVFSRGGIPYVSTVWNGE